MTRRLWERRSSESRSLSLPGFFRRCLSLGEQRCSLIALRLNHNS